MNKIRRTEFGIATGIFLLILFSLLYKSVAYNVFDLQRDYGWKFARYHQVFDYYKHYLFPLLAHIAIVYFSFVFVHGVVVPRFYEKQRYLLGGLLSLPALIILFVTILVSNTWLYGYLFGVYKTVRGVHTHCAKAAFLLTTFYVVVYLIYYAGRYLFLQYAYERMVNKPWFRQSLIDGAVIAGIIGFWIMVARSDDRGVAIMIFCAGTFCGFMYFVAMHRLYPRFIVHRNKKILFQEAIGFWMISLVWMLVAGLQARYNGGGLYAAGIVTVTLVTAIVILPAAWWIFSARNARASTLQGLRQALTHTEAGLDFLRWQINPHFLFNALNTLYGTALQERATATGQGIQQLGDMMRFMLHDNTLESIPLEKEIAYLQNYIALQRLRTQGTPDIIIDVNIDEALCEHNIAPMLLIPFVENAFKYGISQRNKSRINLSLSCTEDKIYFDVYNSIHANKSMEIENESMGIGINNVRQRLNLLYPGRHDLNIRETGTEFFVHLTLVVDPAKNDEI
ncbi:histidine kinase [Chitinophaga sp.]|uniref:sensor histidine kinase n=1 Tax=Chitinophaga sp. TaxID=1869181 RepID=UPI0031D236F8